MIRRVQFADSAGPADGLVQGSDGNSYGTTQAGGTYNDSTLFRTTPAGVTTTLYSFTGGSDGTAPNDALVEGSDGDFYGTTSSGGAYGDGTAFQMKPILASSQNLQ